MNKVKSSLLLMMLVIATSFTTSTFGIKALNENINVEFHYATESFKVFGKCKAQVEEALKGVDGVKNSSWDEKTQMLTVTFNPHSLNLISVKQKVADSGHDTDTIRATDESYKKLARKCSYKRPKKEVYEKVAPGR